MELIAKTEFFSSYKFKKKNGEIGYAGQFLSASRYVLDGEDNIRYELITAFSDKPFLYNVGDAVDLPCSISSDGKPYFKV